MTFEIGVGVSQQWNADKAVDEAQKLVKETLHKKPIFLFVFCTIHYKKDLKNIINLVKSHFGSDTYLIGGTLPGFMTNLGVFTRGILISGYYSDEMKVFPVFGSNTKRSPKLAAQELLKSVFEKKSILANYKNKVLIEFISGPTVPQFPLIKRRRVIKNKFAGTMFSLFGNFFLKFFQNGVGREDEVLQELSLQLSDWNIIGGSTLDDNNLSENYQFFDFGIKTNSIVGMVILTNSDVNLNTTYGVQETGLKLSLSMHPQNERIITVIDNMPAVRGLLKKSNWYEDSLDERLYRRTFHYTIGYKQNNILFPEVIGACYGSDIWVGYKLKEQEAEILTATGTKLVDCVKEHLQTNISKKPFYFLTSCSSMLETLGRKNFFIKEELLDKEFGKTPYFVLFIGGEDTYSKKNGCRHVNYSFNSLSLS